LVQTGLDLLAMPDIFFYETGYSIYTLRQASRRSWRIGQWANVNVKFFYYAGTMQETCLRLMGKKLLVSLAMEGKFANDGLQAIDEGDDILMAMARELVTEKGIGESADAVWKKLVEKQAEVFGVRAVEKSPSETEAEPRERDVAEAIIPPPAPIPALVTQLLMFGGSLESATRRKVSRRPSMSDKALAYGEEPIKHRFLVIFEAPGMQSQWASYLMRSLLSEGRISYDTVEATEDGIKPKHIEREGPTGLITTTTENSLHPENETRYFSVEVDDTPEQTSRVLLATAENINTDNKDNGEEEISKFLALQEWLAGANHRVFIPYAKRLAEMIPPVAVRLRRDFKAILNLIKSHAILHQASRGQDDLGRIIGTIEDYKAVWHLVAHIVSRGVQMRVLKDPMSCPPPNRLSPSWTG